MGSDLSAMIGMLNRSEIEFEHEVVEDRCGNGYGVVRERGYTVLRVMGGYLGFGSDLVFSETGRLVSIEAYDG